jgi:hypothetical protein
LLKFQIDFEAKISPIPLFWLFQNQFEFSCNDWICWFQFRWNPFFTASCHSKMGFSFFQINFDLTGKLISWNPKSILRHKLARFRGFEHSKINLGFLKTHATTNFCPYKTAFGMLKSAGQIDLCTLRTHFNAT